MFGLGTVNIGMGATAEGAALIVPQDDKQHELIVRAVRDLAPGASWALVGFDLKSIEWHDKEIPRPTDQEILEKMVSY